LQKSNPSSVLNGNPFCAISSTRFPTTGSSTQKTPSSKMDFRGSSAGEVVEAIGLGVDVGDIAVQITFEFEGVYLCFPKKWKMVFLPLAQQIHSESGPIKCSEAGVPSLHSPAPFAGRKADARREIRHPPAEVGRSLLAELGRPGRAE